MARLPRQLRREMRREAFQTLRENPSMTAEEMERHLLDEFGDVGFDPTMIALIIKLIIELLKLINREEE